MAPEGPIDPAQLRLAERRLLDTLRRMQRHEPLRADVRVDRLIAELRAASPAKPSSHRGRQPLTLSDGELRMVVDRLVASGVLRREGHRVRLPGGAHPLEPVMQERLDLLIATLVAGGMTPPPAEPIAVRLGIPAALLDQLRAAGDLVPVAPRIDYPRATWTRINAALDRLAEEAPPSVRGVRDGLQMTRRHAEAILRWRRERAHSRSFVP